MGIHNKGTLLIGFLVGVFLISTLSFYAVGQSYSDQYAENFDIQIIRMKTFDNYRYDMYQVMADTTKTSVNGSAPFIVVIHGLGSQKESQLDTALIFARNGFVVFVPDIRGGNSHTGPFSFGVDDVKDLKDLITWVQTEAVLPMVNKSAVGIFGHSMGGFLGLLLASQDPRINCSVIGSAPTNMSQILVDEGFRINLLGSPIDPANESAVAERTPLNYITPTNPKNLLYVHGTLDRSVPFYHGVWGNATANPYNNRTDYEFIVYPDNDHGLSKPISDANSLSGFDDFRIRAVMWYSHYLLFHDLAREDIMFVNRGEIKSQMVTAYKGMYLSLVLLVFPLLAVLQVVFRLIIDKILLKYGFKEYNQKKMNSLLPKQTNTNPQTRFSLPSDFSLQRFVDETHTHENMKPTASVVDVRQPPTKHEFLKMGIYLLIYWAAFWLMGQLAANILYPQVLKMVLFPVFPLIPVIAWKLFEERNEPYFKDLYINVPNTIISVLAAFSVFGIYLGLYNLLAVRFYSRIVIVQFLLQGTSSMTLSKLFWIILPGFGLLIFIVTLYFQQTYHKLIALINNQKIYDIMQHWFVKALFMGIMVGFIHMLGVRLFNLPIPDTDLGAFGMTFTFYDIVFSLGIGLFVGIIIINAVLTRVMKNHIGAVVIMSLILALLYVTAISRVF